MNIQGNYYLQDKKKIKREIELSIRAKYLKELLKSYDVKVTRIAHGLPVGGDISYIDELTLLKAFEGRRDY